MQPHGALSADYVPVIARGIAITRNVHHRPPRQRHAQGVGAEPKKTKKKMKGDAPAAITASSIDELDAVADIVSPS